MTKGILERNELNVSAGKWASIRKEAYRQSNLEHAVYVPALQALMVGGALGTSAGVLFGLLGTSFGVAVGIGVLVGLATCAATLLDGFSWARAALASLEVWESEQAQEGRTESAEVRVEVVDRQANNGYGQTVYDLLKVSPSTLEAVAQYETQLSKRGLMALGFSDSEAMRIVSQLLAFGYATRNADNAPARWTSKGRALCDSYTHAGGGGGGGAKTSKTTSTEWE